MEYFAANKSLLDGFSPTSKENNAINQIDLHQKKNQTSIKNLSHILIKIKSKKSIENY